MMNTNKRILGIDAARGVALIGMVLSHLFAVTDGKNQQLTTLGAIFSGTSVALFMLCAGLSLPFIRSRTALAIRSVILILLGLVLASFPVSTATILTNYGFLFILLIPVQNLKTNALVALTACFIVIAPLISYQARLSLPKTAQGKMPTPPSFNTLHNGIQNITELFLTGYYPLLTFCSYALVGLCLSRLNLRSLKVQSYLLLSGALLFTIPYFTSYHSPQAELFGQVPTNSYAWLNVIAPHAGTTSEMLHNSGYCFIVLALCLVIENAYSSALLPLTILGRMTLSLYVIHCLMTIFNRDIWVHAIVLYAVALLCWYFKKPGPLEFALHKASVWTKTQEQKLPQQ